MPVKAKPSNRPRHKPKSQSKSSVVVLPKPDTNSLTEVFMPTFSPFGTTTHKILPYNESVSVTSTSGVPAAYVFRANDLYDPNVTGTGTQPREFDALMTNYNHFCCYQCMVTVTAKGTSATACKIGIRFASSATVQTDPLIFNETMFMKDTLEGKGIAMSEKTLNPMIFKTYRHFRLSKKNIQARDSLCGTAAATPTEMTYIHLVVWNNTTDTNTVLFDVDIRYYAYFFEPRDPTLSVRLAFQKDFYKFMYPRERFHTSCWSSFGPFVDLLQEVWGVQVDESHQDEAEEKKFSDQRVAVYKRLAVDVGEAIPGMSLFQLQTFVDRINAFIEELREAREGLLTERAKTWLKANSPSLRDGYEDIPPKFTEK